MQELGEILFLQFSTVLTNLKLFHFQTDSYAMHKASDSLHSSISENFDLLMETFSGKYGKIKLQSGEIEINSTQPLEIVLYIKSISEFLDSISEKLNKTSDSDLLTIIDNIKTDIFKFIYLSTLK